MLARDFHLTVAQRALLCKGLSFVPSWNLARRQFTQLQLDMQDYHRRIKLAAYFRNSPAQPFLPFSDVSAWSPPLEDLPPVVRELIHEDEKSFRRMGNHYSDTLNLSPQEVEALQELMADTSVVIKPADKGSVTVVLGREQYVREVERQLSDATYYRRLDGPMYLDTVPMVTSILDTLKKKKFINAKQYAYLKGEHEPRERRFYILPKIHKDPEKWTVPHEIPPGRPIVADCGSETYRVAQYLDYYLYPLSIKHPAFIKDTYHFLQIIKTLRIPADSYFFTMDVEGLYTNIPIAAGVDCVRRLFLDHPDPQRPDEELLQLLVINLTRNDFVFNRQFYLQVKGTAMGKRFAPSYANIFMADWERGALGKCSLKPASYFRYLDDVWGVWSGSREDFLEFVGVLNSHDPSIKLQYVLDDKSINFLDTTVYKGPNFEQHQVLDTKVFFKDTDTHALLHKSSFHPRHTFRGLVKSQLIRFRRICSGDADFWDAVRILYRALTKRGYSRSFLRGCFNSFQEVTSRGQGELIPLVTTFSSASRRLNWLFKSNFERLLGESDILPRHGVISAFRKNKNLRDLLVRARFPSRVWVKPQRALDCFVPLPFARNFCNKSLYRIQQGFSPRSKNCVYLIFCSRCRKQYVGETKHSLSTRMMQHRYNLANRRALDTPLVAHFLLHGPASLRLAGLERNVSWTDWERRKRERWWIYHLGTGEPHGLNVRYN